MTRLNRCPVVSLLLVALVGLTSAACSRPAPAPPPDEAEEQPADTAVRHTLTGQVMEISLETNQVLVRHEEIADVMPGMTMAFLVLDRALLDPLAPGDLITATLVIDNLVYLSEITRTGSAPLPDEAATVPPGI